MNPTDRPAAVQAKVEGRYRVMCILWIALFMAVLLYALLGFAIHPPADTSTEGNDNTTLLTALFVMSVALVVVSFVVKKRFLTRAANEQRAEVVQTGYTVALVLCDTASLLGLIALFATLHTYSYLLFGVGALGMLMHFPRREHLLAASYKS